MIGGEKGCLFVRLQMSTEELQLVVVEQRVQAPVAHLLHRRLPMELVPEELRVTQGMEDLWRKMSRARCRCGLSQTLAVISGRVSTRCFAVSTRAKDVTSCPCVYPRLHLGAFLVREVQVLVHIPPDGVFLESWWNFLPVDGMRLRRLRESLACPSVAFFPVLPLAAAASPQRAAAEAEAAAEERQQEAEEEAPAEEGRARC